MKINSVSVKIKLYLLILSFITYSCNQKTITADYLGIELSNNSAPISIKLELNKKQEAAAKKGQLALVDLSTKKTIPIQMEGINNKSGTIGVIIHPKQETKPTRFKLVKDLSSESEVKAYLDSSTGQVIIEEAGNKVLQYNYQTVYEKDVIRNGNGNNKKIDYSSKVGGIYYEEYLKSHPEYPKDTAVTSAIYAIPRSDYIHPLYGLNGEMLTNDWPDTGHPHHRGIFWAWPEVQYGSKRGDIYALQTIFARPTGNLKLVSGPVFAEINAENLWMWEDEKPIVREHAIIRVYRASSDDRIIDLTINLQALEDSVTIATRFTNTYGGLNIRMQTPESQDISYFTDEKNSEPLRAWSDFNGIFKGNSSTSGLMVLQHKGNPEYPGVWRDYPNLAWVQPTFPTPDTRFQLSTNQALTLRFRLIIHSGGKPNVDVSKKYWDAYNSSSTPLQYLE